MFIQWISTPSEWSMSRWDVKRKAKDHGKGCFDVSKKCPEEVKVDVRGVEGINDTYTHTHTRTHTPTGTLTHAQTHTLTIGMSHVYLEWQETG